MLNPTKIDPLLIEIAKDFPLPVTCQWCAVQNRIEDGSYIIPLLIKTVLLLLLSLWIFHKVRECKPAKLLAMGMFIPQLLSTVLFILAIIGCIQIDHGSGPVLSTIELVAHLLYAASGGAAYIICALKSNKNQDLLN